MLWTTSKLWDCGILFIHFLHDSGNIFLYSHLLNFVVNTCDVIAQWIWLWLIEDRSLIINFKLFSKSKSFLTIFTLFINYKYEEKLKKFLSAEWKCLLNLVLCVEASVWVWGMWYLHVCIYPSRKHKLCGFTYIIRYLYFI